MGHRSQTWTRIEPIRRIGKAEMQKGLVERGCDREAQGWSMVGGAMKLCEAGSKVRLAHERVQ
jgi:hypothetical protein